MAINELTLQKKMFFFLVWFQLAISGFVFMEPAPFDVMFVCLFVTSFLLLTYKFAFYPLIFLLIFIIGNTVSLFFVEDLNRAIKYFSVSMYLILLFLFFVSLINNFKEKIIKIIFSGYCISAVLSSLLGILAFFRIIVPADLFLKYGRAVALFKDPNVFGPFLIPVILYSLFKIEETASKYKKMWWISIFLVITGGVLLSFSRAAWLNMFVSLAIYFAGRGFLLYSKKIYVRKSVITIMMLLAMLSLLFTTILLFSNNFENMFLARLGFQSYDQDRFSTQLLALTTSFENLLGIGPGHSEIHLNYATHNTYARVLVENGIIGFIGYIMFLLLTIKKGLYLIFSDSDFGHIYLIVFASLVGIFINGFFIDTLHWRHFWILLAIPWIQKNHNSTKYVF